MIKTGKLLLIFVLIVQFFFFIVIISQMAEIRSDVYMLSRSKDLILKVAGSMGYENFYGNSKAAIVAVDGDDTYLYTMGEDYAAKHFHFSPTEVLYNRYARRVRDNFDPVIYPEDVPEIEHESKYVLPATVDLGNVIVKIIPKDSRRVPLYIRDQPLPGSRHGPYVDMVLDSRLDRNTRRSNAISD